MKKGKQNYIIISITHNDITVIKKSLDNCGSSATMKSIVNKTKKIKNKKNYASLTMERSKKLMQKKLPNTPWSLQLIC